MGNWNFKAVLGNKSMLAGGVVGLALGAGVAGAAISGLGAQQPAHGFDGASLIKAGDLTPVNPPAGAPMSFADLIEHVSPAVVSIETSGKIKVDAGDFPNLPGFSFPGQEGNGAQPKEQEVRGAGSGFFISADGYIVTNNHVIDGADDITVKLTNDQELKARVVGRDVATDLAVLKVEGKDFPFVRFELEHKPRVGDWVIAMGNPFDFSNTATAGIVSAFGRDLKDSSGGADYVDYIQIDAAINRGNSGGPTFDMYGKVIGINTAIVTPSGANAGVGFAIPADVAAKITSQLVKGVAIQRGYVGIVIQAVDKDTAEALGITDLSGAYVNDITKGGPADKAGLQLGDIIRSVNGAAVKNQTDLTRRIAEVQVGEKVNLGIWRAGKMIDVAVTAALRPSEDQLTDTLNGKGKGDNGSAPNAAGAGAPVIGLSVKPITPDARRTYGLDADVRGLVITDVDDNSDAGQKGVKPGDVIMLADSQPVNTAADLANIVAALKKAGRPSILLLISRDGRNVPLPVSLKDDAPAAGAAPKK